MAINFIPRFALTVIAAAALVILPLAPAHAEWHHGGYGHGYGHGYGGIGPFGAVVALGAAVTGAAVAVATLPFRAVGAVVADSGPPPPPVYAQPAYPAAYAPGYYAPPAPAYYGPPQGYYQPRRVVVYSAPPAYVYPAYGYLPQ